MVALTCNRRPQRSSQTAGHSGRRTAPFANHPYVDFQNNIRTFTELLLLLLPRRRPRRRLRLPTRQLQSDIGPVWPPWPAGRLARCGWPAREVGHRAGQTVAVEVSQTWEITEYWITTQMRVRGNHPRKHFAKHKCYLAHFGRIQLL